MLSDNQKIGVLLTGLGSLFLLFGVLLFFDRALLAMGNVSGRLRAVCGAATAHARAFDSHRTAAVQILFLLGITLTIGPYKTLLFFKQRRRLVRMTSPGADVCCGRVFAFAVLLARSLV